MSYFPEPACSKNKIKDVDTSKFAKEVDLASLIPDVDKLDTGKLEITPADLSKLSNVVGNNFAKKTEYNKLVKKSNTIQTTDASNLVKIADSNTKTGEIKEKNNLNMINILLHKNLIS